MKETLITITLLVKGEVDEKLRDCYEVATFERVLQRWYLRDVGISEFPPYPRGSLLHYSIRGIVRDPILTKDGTLPVVEFQRDDVDHLRGR